MLFTRKQSCCTICVFLQFILQFTFFCSPFIHLFWCLPVCPMAMEEYAKKKLKTKYSLNEGFIYPKYFSFLFCSLDILANRVLCNRTEHTQKKSGQLTKNQVWLVHCSKGSNIITFLFAFNKIHFSHIYYLFLRFHVNFHIAYFSFDTLLAGSVDKADDHTIK